MRKRAKVLSLAKRCLGFWEGENSCCRGWFGAFVCGVELTPSRALFCSCWFFPVLSAVDQLGNLLNWDGFGEEEQEGGMF